ncbi:FAD-binding oxidoreductase [Mangrovibacterium marinum]|uniref:D-amino-acid dehydrogenase n=1 Tax=Mangrovibacterium marinum TaxID=1639118 RepID=A0A2T5BYV3_9BACT|nr:FAD-dependent oxidoreductase [Mangrovibacterium marinum]PTN07429.1 D-amino-acid dehydrogenase [Mangrovibacterium marinum]
MSKIVIVGGGVVGLFTAWYLQKEGAEVIVIERGDFTDGCSFGNAGLIVPSHLVPMASPGMLKKGLKNFFRPASPVAARIAPDADLISWYLKFTRAATQKQVEKSIPVLKELSLFSKSLYVDLQKSAELDFPFWQNGLLMLYKSQQAGEELLEEAELARKWGLKVNDLTAAAVHQLEPHSLPDISGGVHYLSDDHLNPAALMQSLVSTLEKSGVALVRNCPVRQIRTIGSKAVAVETDAGEFRFDQLVITAGIWSSKILKQLKTSIAVQPGKGYSFKVETKSRIQHPALLTDANVAVTPLGGGITQFGGGMEIGYGGYKIQQARVSQIVKAVGEFYPSEQGMDVSEKQIWQGHRPCSFDGLPYIGKAPDYSNVFVGTGHSMMGVTLAPATGKLLSELISGRKLSMELEDFRLAR